MLVNRRFLKTITPPGGIFYYNLVWNKEIKHKLVLPTGDLVFKIFESVPHFKSLIPTKQNFKLMLIFCVVIHTRFRPPFWIGGSHINENLFNLSMNLK